MYDTLASCAAAAAFAAVDSYGTIIYRAPCPLRARVRGSPLWFDWWIDHMSPVVNALQIGICSNGGESLAIKAHISQGLGPQLIAGQDMPTGGLG